MSQDERCDQPIKKVSKGSQLRGMKLNESADWISVAEFDECCHSVWMQSPCFSIQLQYMYSMSLYIHTIHIICINMNIHLHIYCERGLSGSMSNCTCTCDSDWCQTVVWLKPPRSVKDAVLCDVWLSFWLPALGYRDNTTYLEQG